MNQQALRNTILIPGLGLALALGACATPGQHSASARYSIECTAGGTFVNVQYGDSRLQVHPIANVHRGAALEFRLKPDRRRSDETDYEKVKVAIRGAEGIFELTWANDGRATFQFGESIRPGEPHVIWRHCGTHDVFAAP